MNLQPKFAYNVKNYSNFVKNLHVRTLEKRTPEQASQKRRETSINVNKYSTIRFSSSYPILLSLPFFKYIKN